MRFAVDDAVDLAYTFAFDLDLIRPEHVVLAIEGEPEKAKSKAALQRLLSSGATCLEATAANLYRLVWELGQQSGENGIFVFTFAGHGLSEQGQDLLITKEFVSRRPATTGLGLATLLQDILPP